MNFKEFDKYLLENLKKEDIKVEENVSGEFWKYMNTLLEWNKNVNLTAITDVREIIEKHFIDSLTVLKYIKSGDKVIDVGTGAGFPGIPLAICKKDASFTLLDSLNKRINFLDVVKEEINLNNVENLHGRAEDYGKNIKYREMYDMAVSRAVAPLNILLELLIPFVKIGGMCVCMKGPNVSEEMKDIENICGLLGAKYIETKNIKLIDGKLDRNIVIIKKVANTEAKYPRKAGIPAKQPLK